MVHDGLLDGDLLAESLYWVLSLKLLELYRCVLVQELVDREVAAAHSDFDVVLLHFDCDSLGTELIDAFALPHEHYLELGALWIIVDELCQLSVNVVLLDWDVDGNPLLQVHDVLLERLDLNLGILQLFQQLQRRLVCFVDFLFELKDVIRAIFELNSQAIPSFLIILLSLEAVVELLLDVLFLLEGLLEGKYLTVSQKDGLFVSLNSDGQLVNSGFVICPHFFHFGFQIS